MTKWLLAPAVATVLAALLAPTPADAYGACHASYTHVGPNGGVYHTSETVARGPEGNVYAGGHTTAAGYGGASYHAGYGETTAGGYHAGYAGEYHYSPTYSGGSAHYAYVR